MNKGHLPGMPQVAHTPNWSPLHTKGEARQATGHSERAVRRGMDGVTPIQWALEAFALARHRH
jgi:hypothetical protein